MSNAADCSQCLGSARCGADCGVFARIRSLLENARAEYRVVEHPEEGRTDVVSRIRGNNLAQAAKALVLVAKTGKKSRDYYLAVLPGDRRLDTEAFKKLSGAGFVGFADAARAEELTGCVVGSIPPFSFNPELKLVVDPALLAGHDEIVFNAGRLDRSIFLGTDAYVELATPKIHRIAAPETTR